MEESALEYPYLLPCVIFKQTSIEKPQLVAFGPDFHNIEIPVEYENVL